MTYREAKVYLDSIAKYGSVLGLDSIRNLMKYLGNPEQSLKVIHVAGTNGKGSVIAYLGSIFTDAGYKVGRYHSPAVFNEREFILINQDYIEETMMAVQTEKIKGAIEEMITDGLSHPTIFEVETALAFLAFKDSGCDVVLLETGLGGLTDATNVIPAPVLTVFTAIGMDHMAFLGNTIEAIAGQKAGIIKAGSRVVSGIQRSEVSAVLSEQTDASDVPYGELQKEDITDVRSGFPKQQFRCNGYSELCIKMAGRHQIENAALAVKAAAVLNEMGWGLTEENIRRGLETAFWPGRLMCVGEQPLFLVDGAHNIDAVTKLTDFVKNDLQYNKLICIMGVFADKDYEKMLELMAPYPERFFMVTLPDDKRGLSAEKLAEKAAQFHHNSEAVSSIEEAVRKSYDCAGVDDVILAFGSLSYLAETARQADRRKV